jgi:hypothetical protein
MQQTPEQQFRELTWKLIASMPFGTPNKRDLKISTLQAAVGAGLIDETRSEEV